MKTLLFLATSAVALAKTFGLFHTSKTRQKLLQSLARGFYNHRNPVPGKVFADKTAHIRISNVFKYQLYNNCGMIEI